MSEDQWLTTREAAALLDLRDLEWCRELLRRHGVERRRVGPFGRLKWSAEGVRSLVHAEQARVSTG